MNELVRRYRIWKCGRNTVTGRQQPLRLFGKTILITPMTKLIGMILLVGFVLLFCACTKRDKELMRRARENREQEQQMMLEKQQRMVRIFHHNEFGRAWYGLLDTQTGREYLVVEGQGVAIIELEPKATEKE